MALNQISIFLENKSGQLARACKALAANDISLVALSLAESQEFGIARIIVDDSTRAVEKLRAEGLLVKTTPVMAVEVPDQPGSMSKVVETLSESDCDIEYSYAFSLQHAARAILVFRFKDEARAAYVLGKAGFTVIEEDQLKA